MKQYSRVSYEVRCQIYAFLQTDFSIPEIATRLGFNKSTIYRELKRNHNYKKYSPTGAHNKALARSHSKGRKPVIVKEKLKLVLEKLECGWSPEMIAKRYQLEKKESLSHQTIYNYIYKNPELKKLLRFGDKRGCGRRHQQNIRKENLLSIHTRPASAKNRSRLGHWERDGMYGANRKQILVCLERKSRIVRLSKMPNTNAAYVSKLTEEVLKKEKVLTITNDNGTEFRRPSTCKYPVYYCDAMKPHQRGSVENVIGSLRRLIKRTTDLDLMSDKRLKEIEKYINQSPRKMFGYRTPYEVYYNKKVALIN